ncbi:MAG: YfiR/HmsC family protein [bacterium]
MRITVAASLILLLALSATAQQVSDQQDEAVLTYVKNIKKFLSWSGEKAIKGGSGPLFVAAVGSSPLAEKIKTLHAGQTHDGQKIKARIVDSSMLPANAHIVVICEADAAKASALAKKLHGTGTATIAVGSEVEGVVIRVLAKDVNGMVSITTSVSQSLADAEGLELKPAIKMVAKVVD